MVILVKGVLGVKGAWDWLEMVWKRVEIEELESGPLSFFQRACWKGEQRNGTLHGEENGIERSFTMEKLKYRRK